MQKNELPRVRSLQELLQIAQLLVKELILGLVLFGNGNKLNYQRWRKEKLPWTRI